MARKLKKSKISICVFCEGESEQAYTDFLKSKFQDVAVFKRPSSTGLFDDADNRFKKDPKYRDYADLTPPTIEIVGFLGSAARFIAKPCLKQRVMRFPIIHYGCSA